MKQLYRNTREGKIAGVCAGIGEYFNIDPVIIRLIFIVVTVCSYWFMGGIIAYIIAWIIVPEQPYQFNADSPD
jgi:phage shock protein C|tara:strand:+ start:1332 stop:1550 length:219 start_codon:yes stop_codon:yes gene_type:complete